jgi:hypothetical protein
MATNGGSTIASCGAEIHAHQDQATQHSLHRGEKTKQIFIVKPRKGEGARWAAAHLRGAEDVEEGSLGERADPGALDLVERVEDVVRLQDALPLVHVPTRRGGSRGKQSEVGEGWRSGSIGEGRRRLL